MKIKDIVNALQNWVSLAYQENYDNSGLIIGDANAECLSVLITLDVTEAVLDEAIQKKANLIIAHHPLIFKGIKKITPDHWTNRCLIKAIKNDLAVYAIHTNLDNVRWGVNDLLAEKISLTDKRILVPKQHTLLKLVTFVPKEHKEHLLDQLYGAGAGAIGNYSSCSFQVEGEGTFKPNEQAKPFLGKKGIKETVNETRLEVLLPAVLQSKVITALKTNHPYEEVAYYLQPIINENQEVGSGIIGRLKHPLTPEAFLKLVKEKLGLSLIRHTDLCKDKINNIVVCGGSGSFLIPSAIAAGADVLITSDFKYHDFFEANNQIILADIGHYESEVHTKELIHDFLNEKFANIAVRLAEVNTNPIQYY